MAQRMKLLSQALSIVGSRDGVIVSARAHLPHAVRAFQQTARSLSRVGDRFINKAAMGDRIDQYNVSKSREESFNCMVSECINLNV